MKKIIFRLLIITIIFVSCDEDNYPNFISQENSKISTSKYSEDELKEFSNDKYIIDLRNSFEKFMLASKYKDINNLILYSNEGNKILQNIIHKYSKEKCSGYIEELLLRERNIKREIQQINTLSPDNDGNACKRNSDGTTNWSECSFWEGASAYFSILANCGTLTADNYESYANCNQSYICKKCR